MSNLYKLSNETKEVFGVTLHRLEAISDFGEHKAGSLHGWVEKIENVSGKAPV